MLDQHQLSVIAHTIIVFGEKNEANAGRSNVSIAILCCWEHHNLLSGLWLGLGLQNMHNYAHKVFALVPHLNLDIMADNMADDIFICIFLSENDRVSIQMSLNFVPMSPIDNTSALVPVMAWDRTGDKPLLELIWTQSIDIHEALGGDELRFGVVRHNTIFGVLIIYMYGWHDGVIQIGGRNVDNLHTYFHISFSVKDGKINVICVILDASLKCFITDIGGYDCCFGIQIATNKQQRQNLVSFQQHSHISAVLFMNWNTLYHIKNSLHFKAKHCYHNNNFTGRLAAV